MKFSSLTTLCILAGLSGAYLAHGQWGAYIDDRASTPAEAAAYGVGEVIRAQGQYNVETSAAAINMTQAQRNEIENRQAWTKAYFEMRKMNREYRAAEAAPRPTMEDLARYAEAGRPKALGPQELSTAGKISWPPALLDARYADQRGEVEQLFTERATKGAMPGENYRKLYELTGSMLDSLKGEIRSMPPSMYMAAKNFLQSLAYEGSQPAG